MNADTAILVIGPSWVGDLVMAQCLFLALKQRHGDAAIDVVAPAPLHSLLHRMPQVRAALPSPCGHNELALWRRIAFGAVLKGRYAHAYVLPGSWKSVVIPFAARIPRRRGYLREQRWVLLNDIAALPKAHRRRTASVFQALADPDVLDDIRRLHQPRLRIDRENLAHLLARHDLAGRPYVAFAPGAEFGPAKRWPVSHWAQLADRLHARGLSTILMGAAGDRQTTAAIAEARPYVLDLAGTTSLADAIDLLSAAKLVVTNDSGLMHMAAAASAPVVALYGSTSPRDTPPLTPHCAIVSLELPCSPCHARDCPLGHHDCMTKLPVDRVLERVLALASA